MKKALLITILILSMLLPLCGCGGSGSADNAGEAESVEAGVSTAPPEPVDDETDIPVAVELAEETGYPAGRLDLALEEGEILQDAACAGGQIYVQLQSEQEYGYGSPRYCLVETDGSLREIVATEGFFSAGGFQPLDDGSLWYISYEYTEGSSGEMDVSDERLIHVSADGAELGSISASELGGSITRLLPGANGGLIVMSDYGAAFLDSAARITGTAEISGGFLSQMFPLDDGTAAVWHWIDFENDEGELLRIDPDAAAFVPVPGVKSFTSMNVLGGALDRLWVQESQGDLSLYDPSTGEFAQAVAWIDLGIDQYRLSSIALLDANTVVFTVLRDGNSYDLTRDLYIIPAGYSINSDDKITLTLAGIRVPRTVRSLVSEFNMSNDEYYIEVQEYYDYDADIGENPLGDRFLYELSIGELPDILTMSGLDTASLARKGYLASLEELVESGDYLENILDAVRIDETLYTLPISYRVLTGAAVTEIGGGAEGCTTDDLRAWMAAWPDMGVMCEEDRMNVLQYLLTADAQALIDGASVNEDALRDILTLADDIPEDWSVWDSEQFSGGNILCAVDTSSCGNWRFANSRMGTDDWSFVGVPCADGDGHVVLPHTELAVASDTEHAEGCMAFLRYALSSEVQNRIAACEYDIWGLPLRADALTAGIQRSLEQMELTDVDEEAASARLEAVIRSASKICRDSSIESGVINIILDEAAQYFSGEKTLDSTVSAIQSRASIYIAEQG